jgi:hypothetical protein
MMRTQHRTVNERQKACTIALRFQRACAALSSSSAAAHSIAE